MRDSMTMCHSNVHVVPLCGDHEDRSIVRKEVDDADG